MTDGGAFVSLSYLAAERAVAGYGGGMSSAKAALESDTRTLAYELGRLAEYSTKESSDVALTKRPLRINCISAGPLASRAAKVLAMLFLHFYSCDYFTVSTGDWWADSWCCDGGLQNFHRKGYRLQREQCTTPSTFGKRRRRQRCRIPAFRPLERCDRMHSAC